MAKIYELKTHEDEFPKKRKITAEEVKFLKQLQLKMNTQDHLSQADPRYWVIMDYKRIYGKDLNNADGYIIIETIDDHDELYISDNWSPDIEELAQVVKEKLKDIEHFNFECHLEQPDGEKEWQEDVVNCSYDIHSFVENLNEFIGEEDYEVIEYQDIPVESNCFLTHQAAQQHLKANDYHFCDNAHTYAETAWRNPEMEQLYKILHEVDFDSLLQ